MIDALAPRQDLRRRDLADRRPRRARRRGACSTTIRRCCTSGDDQFLERLQTYLDLAPALRERVREIDYVDLRFDERVYVQSRSGRGEANA